MIVESQKPESQKAPIDIVLCATQRCGSTLIVEDMRNTGILGKPEEYFIPWTDPLAKSDWSQPFASVCQRARGDNGITSIKIMANQLPSLDACLATFVRPEKACDFPAVATVFANSHWVWLKRDNIVAQAISRVIAKQTGINHATSKPDDPHFAGNLLKGYSSDYNKATRYRYESILAEVISISLENLCWKRFFQSAAINPLVFTYEEVIKDGSMKHLDQLAIMNQLPIPSTKVARKMVKLSNKVNQVWEDRFFSDAGQSKYKVSPELLALVNP
jgi:LPS sulfotransferase NodH